MKISSLFNKNSCYIKILLLFCFHTNDVNGYILFKKVIEAAMKKIVSNLFSVKNTCIESDKIEKCP